MNKNTIKQETDAFAIKNRKDEEAAKQHIADSKIFEDIEKAIKAFYPTTRFGTLDVVAQEKEQKRLRELVEKEKGSYPAAVILNHMKTEIERLYTTIEKRYERI